MKPLLLSSPNPLSPIIRPIKTQSSKIRCITCTIIVALFVSCKNPPSQNPNTSQKKIDTSARASQVIGTYKVASAKEYEPGEKERGGTGKDFYGTKPWGRLILAENGNYMLTVMVDGLPRFVDKNGKDIGREDGSDEQNRKVVQGSIANFGTYKDSSGFLVLYIEKATYPNWDGIRQPRRYHFSGDTLIYVVPNASSGGGRTAEFKWKRMN